MGQCVSECDSEPRCSCYADDDVVHLQMSQPMVKCAPSAVLPPVFKKRASLKLAPAAFPPSSLAGNVPSCCHNRSVAGPLLSLEDDELGRLRLLQEQRRVQRGVYSDDEDRMLLVMENGELDRLRRLQERRREQSPVYAQHGDGQLSTESFRRHHVSREGTDDSVPSKHRVYAPLPCRVRGRSSALCHLGDDDEAHMSRRENSGWSFDSTGTDGIVPRESTGLSSASRVSFSKGGVRPARENTGLSMESRRSRSSSSGCSPHRTNR